MVEEPFEHRIALVLGKFDDPGGHQTADEQRGAAGVRVLDEDGVHPAAGQRPQGVVLLYRPGVKNLFGVTAGKLSLQIVGQGLIGRVQVGEQGIAAGRRHVDGIEQGEFLRRFGIGAIGMEHHLAVGQ